MRAGLLMRSGLVLLLGVGCVTEERVPPPYVLQEVNGKKAWVCTRRVINPQEDHGYEGRTEPELLAQTKVRPEDPKVWWELGDLYERQHRYPEALEAYQELQACMVKVGKERGKTYAGGLYLLAKTHAQLGQWAEAVRCLQKVLRLKPNDLGRAATLKCFREAHFLLGAIYYIHRQWALAEEHLLAYEALSGDMRAEAMLARIEGELRPERLQRLQRHVAARRAEQAKTRGKPR